MHPAFTILWIASSAILVVGTIVMIVALRRAPEGVEGPDGFHYLREEPRDNDHAVHPVGGELA